MNPLIYVAIGVVVLLVLLLVLVPLLRRRRKERKREEAHDLREAATKREPTIAGREKEALAAEKDADRARREAERLEAGAERLEADASTMRHEQVQRLTKADKLDPDVNRKSDGYLPPGSPERDAAETSHAQTDPADFAEHERAQGPAEPRGADGRSTDGDRSAGPTPGTGDRSTDRGPGTDGPQHRA